LSSGSFALPAWKRATVLTGKISRSPRRKRGSRKSSGSAKSGSPTFRLNEDWNQFLAALVSTATRFLLIGGHAVAVHAEPRFTEDLDVFVEPTENNAARLRAALVEFGFGEIAPSIDELKQPDRVWMLGRKPRRIDILTGISGVTFAQAWRGSVEVTLDAGPVRVIGRKALLANKRASGRTKDLLDVELIEKHAKRTAKKKK
jgi:hypothetical protein